MDSRIGFYAKPKVLESHSFEDDIFENEEDDEEFHSQGYLYDVPYTASSVDRSSIGSIPWADDAIKINKMEWEKVEKMLSGLEPLPTAEDDLSKEILDWQNKFPQLLNDSQHKTNNLRSESLEMESFPTIGLTTDDEDGETEDKITLNRDRIALAQSTSKSSEDYSNNLCKLMDNFTLKSMSFKLRQREASRAPDSKRKCSSSTSSYSLRSPPSPIPQVPLINTSTHRFRMPPILNVLDSRRKFRNLAQNKNPSFVQLTQVQQAKSAAVAQEQKSRYRFQTSYKSAWHVPLAANRFSNNRNSIILPSISNTQRYTKQPTSTNSEFATSNTTPSSSSTRSNFLRINNNRLSSFTNASTQTSTSNGISGRSISAAVKYSRFTTYNALYLPYSASKFHPFN